MIHFKRYNSKEVDFFVLDCREGVSASKEPQYLFLLLLPWQLRNVEVLYEALLIVSRRRNLSRRVYNHIHESFWEDHGEQLAVKLQSRFPDAQSDPLQWEESCLYAEPVWPIFLHVHSCCGHFGLFPVFHNFKNDKVFKFTLSPLTLYSAYVKKSVSFGLIKKSDSSLEY